MLTKIIVAVVLAFAAVQVVPASAAPHSCGSTGFQYDSSGATTGPYCN
jgi:hypothetical protein